MRSKSTTGIMALLLLFITVTIITPMFTGTASHAITAAKVRINEVMASNQQAVPDDFGNYSDWIELYNPSDAAVSLEGWGLSNSKLKPAKWTFPAVTLAPKGYLVIYCDKLDRRNPKAGALHTNFNLSSQGASVMLMDNMGSLVDVVDYKTMASNISLGRDAGDANAWKQFQKVTPGYENSDAGYAQYVFSMKGGESPLQISEVMTSNATTLLDDYGNYSDWVEIHNTGKSAIDLANFGLSDKENNTLKWKFPSMSIAAGGYVVVFCSGKGVPKNPNDTKHLNASFKLSDSEAAILSSPSGQVIDTVDLQKLSADFSYARTSSGKFEASAKPTPGYSNDDTGYQALTGQSVASGPVIINEIMPYNSKYAKADNGAYYGWVEIKNISSSPVNLQGYGLSDNMRNPAKWRFPAVTLQPGETKIILCSGLNKTSGTYLQTGFKLSSIGSVVGLFDKAGKLVDRINAADIPADMSYGRMSGSSGFFYFTAPSPGADNAGGMRGFADTPTIDLAAGIYKGTQKVTLKAGTNSGEIRYTTDGSTPTQSSALYSGPINISKTTALRARAFKSGSLPSSVATSTYYIDSTHTLPLVSIVTDPGLLFDPTTGIYMLGPNPVLVPGSTTHYNVANYLAKGQASERPASFEVFDANGRQTFEQNISIRIQGGFSRDNQQKSFAIYARDQYGFDTMDYQFFSDLPYTQYKAIQLRDGGQDQPLTKIREAVVLNLVKGQIRCLTQDIQPYVVYINGQYWGVYFMEEKRNEAFVAQHTGIADPNSINLLSGSGRIVKNGSNAGYLALLDYVQTHDMSQKANFDYVAARFDTDNYMDLMVHQIYIANSDYGNLEFYQIPNGKWQQIFYDFCWTMGNAEHQTLALRMSSTSNASPYRTMFVGLLQYEPWKQAFIKRLAWAMEHIYTPNRIISVVDQVAGSIASEMTAERTKFTDTGSNWPGRVETIRTFAKQRPANMLAQLKSVFSLTGTQLRSYFDFTDAQLKSEFNLTDAQMQSLFGN